jgi:uncharacterized protein YwgA
MANYDRHLRAARVVNEAGGELVGRTRLQKIVYLAQSAGFGEEFDFEYRHYGPFSEGLADGMEIAAGLGIVTEEEKQADWGGRYSIYRATDKTPPVEDSKRAAFIQAAAQVGAIELELAATAAFLATNGWYRRSEGDDPWEETRRRKPEKAADGRLERAKRAYRDLRAIPSPVLLPAIA